MPPAELPAGGALPALITPHNQFQGGILALDLSGTIGWAYGHPRDARPAFGRFRLPPVGGYGLRMASAENELEDMFERIHPTSAVVESTLSLAALARYSSYQIASQQIGLRTVVYIVAWRYACAVAEIDARTVRSEVMGLPRNTPREAAKREAIRWCRRQGWRVIDDNEADACLIWVWNANRLRGVPPCAGPLWREVA